MNQEIKNKLRWRNNISIYRSKDDGPGRGRVWLRWFQNLFKVEWCLGKHSTLCGAGVQVGGEETSLMVHVNLPYILSIYITIYIHALFRRLPYDARRVGMRAHDGSIWIDLWTEEEDMPIVLHIEEWVKGRSRYVRTLRSEHQTQITLPDDTYPLRVKLETLSWHYPRWWSRSMDVADVTMLTPIPIPVHGISEELGFNEDAIYSLSTPAKTVDEAIEAVRVSVMRDRERYGD